MSKKTFWFGGAEIVGKKSLFQRRIMPYGKGKSQDYNKSQFLGKHPGDSEGISTGSPHRAYGSTHKSPTKERIKRAGKKTARQQAKKQLKESV